MKTKAPEFADMSVLKTILPSLYNNTPEEILEKVNTYKTNSKSMMAKMECKLYVGNIPQGITDRQVTSPAPRRNQQRVGPTQNQRRWGGLNRPVTPPSARGFPLTVRLFRGQTDDRTVRLC
jgi:hypothetical protein